VAPRLWHRVFLPVTSPSYRDLFISQLQATLIQLSRGLYSQFDFLTPGNKYPAISNQIMQRDPNVMAAQILRRARQYQQQLRIDEDLQEELGTQMREGFEGLQNHVDEKVEELRSYVEQKVDEVPSELEQDWKGEMEDKIDDLKNEMQQKLDGLQKGFEASEKSQKRMERKLDMIWARISIGSPSETSIKYVRSSPL
jgi:hypothetical protein